MNVEPTTEFELSVERTAKAPFAPVTGSQTVMRPGKTQMEMLVRFPWGEEEWQPLNIKPGKQVLIDVYHPEVLEKSAAGGKHSRK